jgi:hypothetical protein
MVLPSLLALLSAAPAQAQPPAAGFALEAAKIFYQELAFPRCLQQLERAGANATDPRTLSEIELYFGLCRFNLGEVARAEEHFVIALRLDPAIALPPLTSPKIERAFSAARLRAAEAGPLGVARVAKAQPAPEAAAPSAELARARRPLPTRWVLGAGAGVVAGVVLGVFAAALARQANAEDVDLRSAQLATSARVAAVGANVAFGLAGLCAVAGAATYVWEW